MLRMIHTVFPVLSTTRPCTVSPQHRLSVPSSSSFSCIPPFAGGHPIQFASSWGVLRPIFCHFAIRIIRMNAVNAERIARPPSHISIHLTFKVYPISRKRLSNLTSICNAAYAALVSIAALLLSPTGIVLHGFARICENL